MRGKLLDSLDSDRPLIIHRKHPRWSENEGQSDKGKGPLRKGSTWLLHISLSSDEEVQPKPKLCRSHAKHRKDRHLRKWCPVKVCQTPPQLRLVWHLKRHHSGIPTSQRLAFTAQAQIVKMKQPPPPQPKGTPSVVSLLTKQQMNMNSSNHRWQNLSLLKPVPTISCSQKNIQN